MKKVTMYEAEDGERFTSQKKCLEHEKQYKQVKQWQEILDQYHDFINKEDEDDFDFDDDLDEDDFDFDDEMKPNFTTLAKYLSSRKDIKIV